MLGKYEKYLNLLGKKMLDKHFAEQKDYIFCKEGCSYCCESGSYPYSKLEMQYLLLGSEALSEDQKSIINDNIGAIKAKKENLIDVGFMYSCPFLIDKRCSVYKYRGIICRTHGLLFSSKDKDGNASSKCPECVNQGLNYSNVYEKETKIISIALWQELGIETEPIIYNLDRETLLNNEVTEALELDFGETKTLIDWF